MFVADVCLNLSFYVFQPVVFTVRGLRALCSSELGVQTPSFLKLSYEDPIVVTEYMEGGDVEHFMFRCPGLIEGSWLHFAELESLVYIFGGLGVYRFRVGGLEG